MTQVIYDGTYEGWLTAVFEIYEYKLEDIVFAKNDSSAALFFADTHEVTTNIDKANRIMNGLKQRLSKEGFQNVYCAFLSEINGIDEILFLFAKYVFSSSN